MSHIYQSSKSIMLLVRMSQPRFGFFPHTPRKRFVGFLLLIAGVFTVLNFQFENFPWEDLMEHHLVNMQSRIELLSAMYQTQEENVMRMQRALLSNNSYFGNSITNLSSDVLDMLKNMTGTKTAEGLQNLQLIRTPFMCQLLPHLMIDTDPITLRPAFHMRTRRHFVDIVMGIPTVKRYMANYLLITLSHLIQGINDAEINKTLIIVFIGETDLKYVLQTAHKVETYFPKYVATGLIEVLSPTTYFYPDFNLLSVTLEDSGSHFRWRTKENLDAMYLMAYAQSRGTYYLNLQDDVIAERGYMQKIKEFTAAMTVTNPSWYFIDYSGLGGIGKLFRSADLLHFITYVQLFYTNLPLDWLMESYLSDRICSIDKETTRCGNQKAEIRPTCDQQLFVHIGLLSSEKGKSNTVVKILDHAPTVYNHSNPPAKIRCDLLEMHVKYNIRRVYDGESFFWGSKPKKGDIIAFIFQELTVLESFKFQSGNAKHTDQKFYYTVVEIRQKDRMNYISVGAFDEFGIAEGKVGQKYGPLVEIRLRVVEDQVNTRYWVVLNEIHLKVWKPQ